MNNKSQSYKIWANVLAVITVSLFILSFLLGIKSTWSTLTIILAFIGLFTTLGLRSNQSKEEKNEEVDSSLNSFMKLGLNDKEFLFNSDKTMGLSFNEDDSNIVYVYRDTIKDNFIKEDIPFGSVLDVSIDSNGSQLITSSKAGLVGGAIAGSLITGGLGFGSVIGAMGANKSSESLVKSMTIKVTLDNLSSPVISFKVIDYPKGLNKNSVEYNKIIRIVDEWFGKFTIILKRNEKQNGII